MVRLTEIQRQMYEAYLDCGDEITGGFGTKKLFADQQTFYRIWTHPYTFKIHEIIMENKVPINLLTLLYLNFIDMKLNLLRCFFNFAKKRIGILGCV